MGSCRTATGRLFTQSGGSFCLDFGELGRLATFILSLPDKHFAFSPRQILLQVYCRGAVLAGNPTSLLVLNNGQQM